MDIRQLKYFVAIADSGSLSQAAQKLHVSQSALSHNLSQLEEELQTQLFYRRPRGVEVTEGGKKLYEYARKVLNTIEDARREVSTVGSSLAQQVWIGSNHTATRMLLPSLPKRLRTTYSNVKFGFVEDLSNILIEYIVDGRADIAVVYNPPSSIPLVTLPILEEQICCVGSNKLLGQSGVPITFDELIRLPLILAGQGANLRGIVRSPDQAKRLESACIMECNSYPALVSVLHEDLGCSVLSHATVYEEIEKGLLAARPIIEPKIKRELHVVYSATADNPALLEQLASLIRGHIHERIAEHPVDGVSTL